MENEKYIIQFICTANSCRSRMAQASLDNIVQNSGLKEEIETRSSGIFVDDIGQWGSTKFFPMKTILKVLKVAYRNGIHAMTDYKGFIEQIITHEDYAVQKHDEDKTYRDELNMAASQTYQLVEQFDRASTMLALAEEGLVYPRGEPRQFVEDGSDLYVLMEAKHVDKVKGVVGEAAQVKCFEKFIDGKTMQGSLTSIRYSEGKLDIHEFRKIYQSIKKGCSKMVYRVDQSIFSFFGL